jgi:hypothetical protein
MIQAVAQTRIDDFMRASRRQQRMAAADAARSVAPSAARSIRLRRRLRIAVA